MPIFDPAIFDPVIFDTGGVILSNFPVTIDNDGTLLLAQNYVRSPLASSMNSSQATIPVVDVTQFPVPYGFVAKPGAASGVAVAGAGLGIGVYKYQIVYVTSRDGATFETDGGTEFSVTTTGGNQQVNLSAIPTIGSSFVTGRKIYRTLVGGATGTEKFVALIGDNVTTTYSDNVADGSLGASVLTTNTTGATYYVAIDAITSATREICGYTGVDTGGNLLTGATRGQRGTSNFAHGSGVLVEQNIVDAFHEFLKSAIVALETKVGVNSASVTTTHDYKLSEITGADKAVGKSATQTLTNKTLTSPIENTPTWGTSATISTATFKIIPGATSFTFRNNLDNASNMIIADAGDITFRATVGGITTLTATTLAGTLSTAAQTNVTSVGTLTSLTVSGTTTLNGTVIVNNAGTATFNRQYLAAKFAVAFSATPTFDFNNSNVQSMTLTNNITSSTFSNGVSGGRYVLVFTQDSTGSRTVTWPGSVKWGGGTAPTLSGANKIDVFGFVYDGTSYYGTAGLNF